MSKFPGQNGRNGKGRNRRNRERNEQADGNRSTSQNKNHQEADASGNSAVAPGRRKTKGPVSQGASSFYNGDRKQGYRANPGRPVGDGANDLDRSTLSSKQNSVGMPPAGLGAAENSDGSGSGNSVRKGHGDGKASQTNSKRNRRRNGRKRSRDEIEGLRNLRQPVKPAPSASYSPKEEDDKDGVTGKPHSKPYGKPRRHQGSNHRRGEQGLYAALDLGTNNCRLLVAVPQERGRFRVVDGFSRIVRLGEGLDSTGRLSDEAMDRAVEALKICSEKLISHNIKRHRLIATEACRQASNGVEFLERVRSETGMTLEIVNRETEAYLAAEGCGALMDRKADAAVLFDIGGGSSELVLVNRQGKKKRISDQIVSWTSVPVGVVTLAERHGGKTVNGDIFQGMIKEVREYLDAFEGRDELARIWRNGRVHLLGTSGTVTTLAGIHLKLPRYERRLVDGLWLSGDEIDTVISDLLAMDYRQRANSPCIGRERADLVMAGCAILEAIRQTWPSNRLRVADRGLREGILTQLMERDAAWLPPKQGRWRRGNQYRGKNRNARNNTFQGNRP